MKRRMRKADKCKKRIKREKDTGKTEIKSVQCNSGAIDQNRIMHEE
jgi:hypothetical protein